MSTERRRPYPFDLIEPKWQAHWEERQSFHAPNPGEPGFDPAKPKYFVLDMFPYPSGAGLHVGHPEGYTAMDIIARFKRMCGFNVLHPMGWDAFGLPAEQYAIKTGQHPAETTARNVAHFKGQLQRIGFAYDWQREVNTTDTGYYRWTQWIFLQLYASWFNPETQRAEAIETYTGDDPDAVRLAYVSDAPVNWCQELGTVLANEEVIDGKSEVGGFPVERRPMRQWMLRITAFAQRLIEELDGLDWPESIKLLQRNWIGRSEGAEVVFQTDLQPEPPLGTHFRSPRITVFTTRPDTLFGATYMVLAPEHPLVDALTTKEQRAAVEGYRTASTRKSDLERTDLAKDKSGVFTGAHALNPVNGLRIPIWIADYVLLGYGTGAIMAVPAHDERDWEFAKKFNLPIRQVVQPAHGGEATGAPVEPDLPASGSEHLEACFAGEGVAINSPLIDGLPTTEAKAKITAWLEERGLGTQTINFKLRDWLFSRQRYWGEPFPIVWEDGQHRAIDKDELPLTPPAMEDFKPTGTPEPPLSKARDWVRYSDTAVREVNTMPQWAGSCWYYLRYCDPSNAERFVGREAERYWMGGVSTDAAPSRDTAGIEIDSAFEENVSLENAAATSAGEYAGEEIHPRGLPHSPDEMEHEELGPIIGGEPVEEDAESEGAGEESPTEAEPTDLPPDEEPTEEIHPRGLPRSPDEIQHEELGPLVGGEPSEVVEREAWGVERPSDAAPSERSTLHAPRSTSTRQPGGVDLYVGGTEHAVLHLLYARFWHKVLFDLGHVSTPEPFQRLVNQGIILGDDGQKMSKARGNVVNPDDVIAEYGADAFRCYEMFMGPLEQMKPWSMTGVEGVSRFLARVWRLAMEENQAGEWTLSAAVQDVTPDKAALKVIHATIKKVTEDIEALSFNTAISQMMIFVNHFTGLNPRPLSALRTLLVLLNPFAPHLTEELWERLGSGEDWSQPLAEQQWPGYDAQLLVEDEIEMPIQVNGKVRDKLVMPKDATNAAVEAAALASPRIQEWTAGNTVKKVIVVPGKLVNVVVG